MKNILILMVGLLLISLNVIAQDYDVSIDKDGNVTTGTSILDANFKVITSGENAIVGETSGGSVAGVYGVNTNIGNYGMLGYDTYGVYGYGGTGFHAGYFDGDVEIIGNLDVFGMITGYTETDPVYSLSPASAITPGQITNWNAAYDWGDHSIAGYVLNETDPVFSGWNKSTGISISESQIINLDHFTTTDETDPTVNTLGKSTFLDSCFNGQIPKIISGIWDCASDKDIFKLGYDRVATVEYLGGIGSYLTPKEAMDDIDTWCPYPSSTSPCLLKIFPGSYGNGTLTLYMQPYVDIEGSGEKTTFLNYPTIDATDYAEIRSLTIQGSIVINNTSFDITNVTIIPGGGTGLSISGATSSDITNVKISPSVAGNAIYIDGPSSPVFTNVTVINPSVGPTGCGNSSFGVFNSSTSNSTVIINSSIDCGIQNDSGSTIRVAHTMVGFAVSGGGFTCIGAYDQNFAALSTTCD